MVCLLLFMIFCVVVDFLLFMICGFYLFKEERERERDREEERQRMKNKERIKNDKKEIFK